MSLFDFLKPKEQADAALLEKAKARGFTLTPGEEGSLTLTGPDGIEYAVTGGKALSVRFKQPQPYKILFKLSKEGHFVNDPNPEGYRALIDSLHAARSPIGCQNAVLAFLLTRYNA